MYNVNSESLVSQLTLGRSYTSEMKWIYQAPTEEVGLMELDAFEEKCGAKYALQ